MYHAAKIIDKIDLFVVNLSKLPLHEIDQLIELGKKHYDFGVKEKYFKVKIYKNSVQLIKEIYKIF